ncbi:uncharacterized protein LOC111758285 [Cavia porcellus]|uniref:uncharacterized protein LOC111758285 n=1 Tax=Cavia porcellus TaxID=10141 RepID=UPI000C879F29|nr:uncharacterized protein LOC111758285 [Cavia porcellus]
MNWTSRSVWALRDSNASMENLTHSLLPGNTTLMPETSVSTAASTLSGSIGVMALVLLLVGLLVVILKKWRHERLFKKQLRHQTKFLHKPLDFSCGAEAVYCNVINLAPWKEDDFAIYANMPRFDWPPRTRLPPDQVEYASIVFR